MELTKFWILAFALIGERESFVECAETKYFRIVTMIQNRFAETTISSEVLNDANNTDEEVGFHVMLPKEAFITYFDMTINGTKYEGEIEEKVKAERIFEEAKVRGKTAGIVKTVKQANKIFKTAVNIAAGESVTFTLIYQQLLRKYNGKIKNTIILLGNTLQSTVSPTINVYICESQKISDITAPDPKESDEGSYEYDVSIHSKENWAHVEFFNIAIAPDKEEPEEYEYYGNTTYVPHLNKTSAGSGSFVVEYELEKDEKGGKILADREYLMHFFAPEVKKPPRRAVFVLDISGSMVGRKLQQLTDAMMNILDKFTEKDRIGLVKFSSYNYVWQKGNIGFASPESVESAKNFMRYPHSNDYTYIWKAVQEALNMLAKDVGEEEVNPQNNMVILLTDGLGILGQSEMMENIENLNRKRFAIHTVGFGDGVDASLLKAVAANNHGSWKQILEGFDAQLQIENYIDELGIALMSDVKFEYPGLVEETVQVDDRYLYGGEIIAMSRMKKDVDFSDRGPHVAKVKGFSTEEIVVEAKFYLEEKTTHCEPYKEKEIKEFGKKAFGMLKVEEVLRDYDAELNSTVKEIFKEKAIKMSLLYKLVTPVTSMLVVKPSDKEELENAIEMQESVAPTEPPVYGYGGGWHASAGGSYAYGDPHFVVRLTSDINVCFNWPLRDRRVVNLLYDEDNSVVINALMMGPRNEKDAEATKQHGLFIRTTTIILPNDGLEIVVDEEKALVIDMSEEEGDDGLYLPLVDVPSYNATYESLYFTVHQINEFHTLFNITIRKDICIAIDVRQHNPMKEMSRAHLDVSLADSKGLSDNARGFFGSLHVPGELEKLKVRIEENRNKKFNEKMPNLLIFKDRRIPVCKTEKNLPHHQGLFDCWWVGNVTKLVGSPLEYFDEKSLFDIPK